MINSIISIQGKLIAVSSFGNLIVWDNVNIGKSQNTSLQKSSQIINICQKSLNNLILYKQMIACNTKNTVYFIPSSSIISGNVSEKVQTWNNIGQNQKIISICGINNFVVITNVGNIYTQEQEHLSQFNIDLSQKNKIKLGGNKTQITSAIAYRQNTLLLLGCTDGKVLSVNLISKNIIFQLKNANSIDGMHLYGDRLYCLHKTCITQWSIHFGECLSFIEIDNPLSILKIDDVFYISRPHFTIVKYQVQTIYQIQTSMRCVNVILYVQGQIILGGSNETIDIFNKSSRIYTLLK